LEPAPVPPLTWRTDTVREYRPDRRQGRLTDDESGAELWFRSEVVQEKGWSPGRKAKVRYAVREVDGRPTVVRLERV
jgi:hypothetical protein